jgi:translation initiation factor IF-1
MGKKFDKHLSRENQHKKEEGITVLGQVIDVLGGDKFKIRLENDFETICYLGGNMRRFKIRVLLGDWVDVELPPYDLTRGRIKFRHKGDPRKQQKQVKDGNTPAAGH